MSQPLVTIDLIKYQAENLVVCHKKKLTRVQASRREMCSAFSVCQRDETLFILFINA